jgi:RNA polymerase sigma-70 factor (ECF subfamily)
VTAAEEAQATQLMRLANTGDEAAYAEVLALLTTATKRFARGRAGRVAWVDDVVQETLISVHRARHTWDPSRPLAPWFYAIASHRLVDVWRRERRVASREQGQDTLEAPAPDGAAGEWDDVDMSMVHAALAALPARQRDIVEGLKLRDDSVRGLAARHRMSESAVKVMAHRGYKRLRSVLGGESRERR